jgi:hypothetical protein
MQKRSAMTKRSLNPWLALARLILVVIPVLFLVGIVVWNRAAATSGLVVAECESSSNAATNRLCYENYLREILQREGASTALRTLELLENRSPIVRQYCHEIAHTLGHAGLEQYGTLAATLSAGTMACFAGYYHGAIEVALHDKQTYAHTIQSACVGTSGLAAEQCLHGLGHGILRSRQYDLELALPDCDLLAEEQRSRCYSGLFMEDRVSKFGHTLISGRAGRIQDDGTDFWPCFSVGEQYRRHCFYYGTARLLYEKRLPLTAAAAACRSLPEEYRSSCVWGFGKDAAWEGLRANDLSKTTRARQLPGSLP